ncbi:hypothetical protein Q7P35_010749 [Cladosporium inversicolor]
MAPIIRNSMPAGDLDIKRYVAPGEVATISAMDTKAIEHQNAFQPSLAPDSGNNNNNNNNNNKWLKDLALNPSHIEIQPTTFASLHARDVQPDNEPNAINCNSFSIRGGHRCQLIGGGLDIQSRLRKNHGQRQIPRPISKQADEPKLSRRNKGSESHRCGEHDTDGRCAQIVSPRDTHISEIMSNVNTFANIAAVEGFDNTHHDLHKHREMKHSSFLGDQESKEDMEAAIAAYHRRVEAHKRARATTTAVGISVTVVVCVFLLGLIFLYLRKRSKKLAAARGRVAELELETRTKGGDVQGV